MVTIFTIPKPFTDHHTAMIQTNAVQSWKKITRNIFLFGDDPGVKEAARKLSVTHFPKVKRNELGTPFLSPAFKLAAQKSPSDYLCYVNADILFLPDFLKIFEFQLPEPSFLAVGQRWDLEVSSETSFHGKNWTQRLRSAVGKSGSRHAPSGSDFFLFRKGQLFDLPDFVVGRSSWDNWMIYESRRRKIPVIDAGDLITAIHQNHNYAYYKGPGADVWSGPEVKKHFEIIGGKYRRFDITDADWIIKSDKLSKRIFPLGKLWQYASFTPEVLPGNQKIWRLAYKPARLFHSFYFSVKGIFHQAQERAIVASD